MISGLRPPILDEAGVVAAIDYLVSEARQSVPQIEFVHRSRFSRLARPLESAIFRIVQEALTNVRRHSGSQRALVELKQRGQSLRLKIQDWGRGFDVSQMDAQTFGLQGIRQRARLLNGRVAIESGVGKGTQISVELPLVVRE